MDEGKVIIYRPAGQGALRKYYRKRDGSWALAIEIAPNVVEFGRLVPVPRRTVLDGYADAIGRARAALRTGLAAGDAHTALAVFEAAQDAALALLREAFEIMSALDHDKIDEIRNALIDAADEITSEHPHDAIDALDLILCHDLSGADAGIIERVIRRLELIDSELRKVADLLSEAPFSFGKLNDGDEA